MTDENEWLRAFALNVLAQIERYRGHPARSLNHATEALKISRQCNMITPSSLTIAADVSNILRDIVDISQAESNTKQVINQLEWYCQFPRTRILRMDLFLFRILINVSIVWHKVGEHKKSEFYEEKALNQLR